MKQPHHFLNPLFLLLLHTVGCSQTHGVISTSVFVGSTPCDATVRALLKLPSRDSCDFIRWELSLESQPSYQFKLRINLGEAQPNTSGFRNGGQKFMLDGSYRMINQQGKPIQYQLITKEGATLTFLQLNENLLHLLDTDQHVMIGNGGWNYTLSRKGPVDRVSALLPFSLSSFFRANDSVKQLAFQGRTPCRELAEAYDIQVDNDCIKIKWMLTLSKDAVTLAPSGYVLRSTLTAHQPVEGSWKVIKSTDGKMIVQLDSNRVLPSLYFDVVEGNLLILLDKKQRPLTGDANFSYSLSRKID